MSTQQQEPGAERRERERPAQADETKPTRPAETRPEAPATTPHEGGSKEINAEELSPDDFE